MLDGITILNTIPATSGTWVVAGWIGLILIIICAIIAIIVSIKVSDFGAVALWGLIIFLGLMLMFGSCLHPEQYKVTVDDTASVVEFNERYKVLDQEGPIYTIELK